MRVSENDGAVEAICGQTNSSRNERPTIRAAR